MFAKTTFFFLLLGLIFCSEMCLKASLCESPCWRRCFCFCPDFEDLYFRGGYTSKEGIGRKEGYGTLAAFFFRNKKTSELFPYIDVRLHIMDNTRLAGNVGFGFQKSACDASTMLRGYFFFDWRDTRYRLYKQLSVGAEWSGPYFNMYGNLYLPLNSSGHKRINEYRFRKIFRYEQVSNDYSYRGFDLNASRYIYLTSWYRLFIAPGIYYYRGRKESVYGGKLRFEIELYRSLVLTVQTSYDQVFHTRTYAAISLTLPTQGAILPDLYRTVPIRREEIIPVKESDFERVFRRR